MLSQGAAPRGGAFPLAVVASLNILSNCLTLPGAHGKMRERPPKRNTCKGGVIINMNARLSRLLSRVSVTVSFLVLTSYVFAQMATGTVRGTVTDASGARVPGVNI